LVKQVISETAEQKQYRKILPRMPQTADGNWIMAKWCKDKKLSDEFDFHAREVLRLDPDHAEARQALGYRKVENAWVQPDDLMREQGFVKHNGKWRLPQDIELEEARKQIDIAEKQWKSQLKTWRNAIDRGRKQAEAIEGFRNIDDPNAGPALAELLEKEPDVALCRLYIEILGRLRTGVATKTLIHTAINHYETQVRDAALTELAPYAAASATRVFRSALASKNHRHVLNAAAGIERMNQPEAVPDLINALVTEHQVKVTQGAGSGQIGASFSPSGAGGGLSVGSKTTVVKKRLQNLEVLTALRTLTKEAGVNFGYDQEAWRAWYASESAPPVGVSLRRSR
jgi:hypothetical protein